MFFILNIVFIQYALFSKYIIHAFVFLDIEFNRFVPDLDMDSKRSKHFLCILFGQFCLAPVHKVNTHWGQVNIERNAWKCHFVSVLRISAYTVNHLRKTNMPPEQTDVLWRELHLTTRYVRGLDLNFFEDDCDASHKMALILHLYWEKIHRLHLVHWFTCKSFFWNQISIDWIRNTWNKPLKIY